MELLQAHGIDNFHILEDNLSGFDDDEDSGLSSSPSTPGPADNENDPGMFGFENESCSNLVETLNTCLFDGELPSKLYTHIKIKEDCDDEPWQSATFPDQLRDVIASQSLSLSSDFFGEPFELLNDIFEPSTDEKVDDERSGKLQFFTEDKLKEACPDDSSDETNDFTTNIVEEPAIEVVCTSEDVRRDSVKRKLRTRNKISAISDHNYVKLSHKASEANNEFGDDDKTTVFEDTEAEEEDEDDDDEDFKPSCSAKKSRRASSNPGMGKNEKYWERRKRNNLAAKRSREAKRAREIAVAKKTSNLEKENNNLRRQVQRLKAAISKAEKKLRAMV